jgi:hypothetical protein
VPVTPFAGSGCASAVFLAQHFLPSPVHAFLGAAVASTSGVAVIITGFAALVALVASAVLLHVFLPAQQAFVGAAVCASAAAFAAAHCAFADIAQPKNAANTNNFFIGTFFEN